MTVQHAIVAFPALEAAERIESVRRRFDPLATVLDAHVTLVFPFADAPPVPQLDQHIGQAIAGFPPFDFALAAPAPGPENHLFLSVTSGADHFVQLHDHLYAGALARHRSKTHVYRPHITIGRLATSDQLMVAAAEAIALLASPLVGRVESLAVFRLDQPLSGAIASTVRLGQSA